MNSIIKQPSTKSRDEYATTEARHLLSKSNLFINGSDISLARLLPVLVVVPYTTDI